MGSPLCKIYCGFCPCHYCRDSHENGKISNEPATVFYINPQTQTPHYISLHDYRARTEHDLSVQRGDKIEVLEKEGDWCLVRKVTARGKKAEEGYIPSGFVARAGSIRAARWYFGSMIHMDATRCLLRNENNDGSFLVWQHMKENGRYVLSVRHGNFVEHYRIQGNTSFHNLSKLIDHYSKEPGCLCTTLDKPCIKLDQPSISSLAHTADWEIQHESLQKVTFLGHGQFGQVWQGVWNNTTDVAIKELIGVSSESKMEFLKEVEIMQQLNHEKLIKLYAVCTMKEPFCIVSELMKMGNLHNYLQSHSETRNLEFSLMIGFAIQIAEGMAYLEEKHYIHRDLRTENILLTEMLSCKIADFGLSRLLENKSHRLSLDAKVPIKWMAPEIFTDNVYTTKSDVWSFGILLMEIVTYGKQPFSDDDNPTYVKVLMEGSDITPPAGCPDDLGNIMLQCWKQKSEERPTFNQLQDRLMACNPIVENEEMLSSAKEMNIEKIEKCT